jgi:predicted DNA-binding WGR domain protein
MSDWTVELEFNDGSSKKFWRGRTDGSDFIVNYGRIGTDGQSKTKGMGSVDKANAELEKVANSKRKKGYDDVEGGGAPDPGPVVEAVPEVKDKKGKYKVQRAGQTIVVEIETEGASIETEIEETHASPEAAAASYDKIVESLIASGYKKV